MPISNQAGEKGKIWPENVDEAVKHILSVMPMSDRAPFRNMERDELIMSMALQS
jgi:sulfite reductase alpha subunit-like flavoprotein